MDQSLGKEIIISREAQPHGKYDQTSERCYVSIHTDYRFNRVLTAVVALRFWVFREPVDPIALGIPTYYDVIPKKDARDLQTIRTKLEADRYTSVEAWEADLELMISNALKFNGPDSEVGQIGKQLRARCKELATGLKGKVQQGTQDKQQPEPQPNLKKRQAPSMVELNSKKIRLAD